MREGEESEGNEWRRGNAEAGEAELWLASLPEQLGTVKAAAGIQVRRGRGCDVCECLPVSDRMGK